jgi:preprotein translocase subunit SecA
VEYRLIGSDLFDEMIADIRESTVRMVLSAVPQQNIRRTEVARPTAAGFAGGKPAPKKASPAKSQKVGRNDLCPCGSGKKYKKCCGAVADKE